MSHPFLNRFEAWLFTRLIRSRRIGAIVVKQFGEGVTWYLSDPKDPMLDTSGYDDEEDVLVLGAPQEEPEPASMLLERLFHAPDAER